MVSVLGGNAFSGFNLDPFCHFKQISIDQMNSIPIYTDLSIYIYGESNPLNRSHSGIH